MAKHEFDAILLHGYTHRFPRQIIRGKKRHNYKVILRAEFAEMPRRAFNWKSIPRKIYLGRIHDSCRTSVLPQAAIMAEEHGPDLLRYLDAERMVFSRRTKLIINRRVFKRSG